MMSLLLGDAFVSCRMVGCFFNLSVKHDHSVNSTWINHIVVHYEDDGVSPLHRHIFFNCQNICKICTWVLSVLM